MKKIMSFLVTILLTSTTLTSCSGNSSEVTICECENLFMEYSDKKDKAKTEKERNQISLEELKKNRMCYDLEKSLGSKLESERAKCQ